MKMIGTLSSVKILASFLVTLSSLTPVLAQLVEVPIATYSSSSPRHSLLARTQDFPPLNLPFWDDFSNTGANASPQENLWQFGKSVFLNNGLGINQPSRNVVTFDGVDSLGKPYNVNDALAKGLADKLVSLPIRLDLVDPALRPTVYLSFYYQVKGPGESTDNGDQLIVSFKNLENKWESVYTIENSTTLDPEVFYQVLLPVADERFYHNAFQFRIQNFARLSGPYDSWNVDYVYLNTGRSPADTSYPDRTVSSSLNSLFQDYYSMPIKHFIENPSGNLKKPSITLFNLRAGNIQPFDYTTQAKITTINGQQPPVTATIPLDAAADPGSTLNGLQFFNLTLNTIPSPGAFDPLADSIHVQLRYGMTTKDNVPPALLGDYDPAKYSPIDFRFNDTIRTQYSLASYYAYDDGYAEYGAGLNQTGSYLAYKYTMKSNQPDNLAYVNIYFPEFGDNTSQSVQLEIRTSLTDAPSSILYKQNILVNRTTQNKFTRYTLTQHVQVKGVFYIGWKQLSSATIPVGLDKNTDNGDKIYYNTNGLWIQNVTVKGSLMVRPGFGGGNDPVVGLEPEDSPVHIYPNPTTRSCYLPAGAENIFVCDITGGKIETEQQEFIDKRGLTFLSPITGLVIVRYFLKGKLRTEKVMVRVE